MSARALVLLVLAASAAIVAAVVAGGRSHTAASIPPVPHAATASQEARNLEAWLRRYSK